MCKGFVGETKSEMMLVDFFSLLHVVKFELGYVSLEFL